MKNTRVKVRHTATHSPIARERASLWNGYWPWHCLIADSIPEPCHIRPLTHEKCEIKFLTVVLAVAPNALAPARYYNNNHFFSVRVRVSSWRMVRVCAMGKIDLGLSYIQWISVARFSIYHDEKREVVDGGARAHEKKKKRTCQLVSSIWPCLAIECSHIYWNSFRALSRWTPNDLGNIYMGIRWYVSKISLKKTIFKVIFTSRLADFSFERRMVCKRQRHLLHTEQLKPQAA